MYSKKFISMIIVAGVFLSAFLIAFFLFPFAQKNTYENNSEIINTQYVKLAGKLIKVDLAIGAKEQEQGLSGRFLLKEDEGMLFIFQHPARYTFWMKDMNFPIDIIWIGPDFKIVYIKKNVEPISYPDTFTPSENAKYVLEVVSGFSAVNNLQEGDSVEFVK